MKSIRSFIFFASMLNAAFAWPQFGPIGNGPIHEAFVTKNYGSILLNSVPISPPDPITEDAPPQVDFQAEWIHGYWAWVPEKSNFIWTSGVWRRPPPEHFWIHGFWKEFEEGWVWIKGFWTKGDYESLTFMATPPPDSLDENPGDPPTANVFWAPGYWQYRPENQEFAWINGGWELLDPHWVFIPTHYLWQPEGYICLPGYWDWPINFLGRAYESVEMAKEAPPEYYHPSHPIKTPELIKRCFLSFPDYLCFFQHHFHFHQDYWKLNLDTPSWWRWKPWWSLNWHHQWALWWWYGHPGYPQPTWLSPKLGEHISPPTRKLLKTLQNREPPLIVRPQGVISYGEIIQALSELNKRGKEYSESLRPILPPDSQALKEIHDLLPIEAIPPSKIIRPTGFFSSTKKISNSEVLSPLVEMSRKSKANIKTLDGKIKITNERVTLPQKPSLPQNVKTIKTQAIDYPLHKILDFQKLDFIREKTPYPNQKRNWEHFQELQKNRRLSKNDLI